MPATYKKPSEKNTLIFQSLEQVEESLTMAYAQSNFFPFAYPKVKPYVSPLKCFEVAAKHRLYFFAMKPLTMLKKEELVKQIYEPLMAKRDGKLTDADRIALRRLADEFQIKITNIEI